MSKSENAKYILKKKWAAIIPFLCVIAFFLIAYILELQGVQSAYGWASLVFIVIPFEYVIVGLKKFRFIYPVFVAVFYIAVCLIVGECTSHAVELWHPLWVVFLTIPVYYILYGDKNVKKNINDAVNGGKKYKNGMNVEDDDTDFDADDNK